MNKIPVIKSQIFENYAQIKFGFSTRIGGVSPYPYGMNLSFNVGDERVNVIKNRELFFGELKIGLDELAIPQQVQGGTVKRVYVQGGYDECDGLITNSYGVFLTVTTADCLPVFLFDPVTKSIGAVHAGWRGLLLNIVPTAIRMMWQEFRSFPENIKVFIAPAAGVCCYEIMDDVGSKFPEEFKVKSVKTFLDIKLYAKMQLINSGVSESNIEISEYCTICNPDLFHSHRRDKKKSGRMMGVIGLVR
ncbi:MAG: hypothetical protein IGBAC_0744 [Ignavibacteriae bacterium]|nr:MAG: hypothetical protein IGBAC_0744 [Ignavibacteriota bacterium]